MSYVRVSILGDAPGGEKWSINPVFDPNFEWGDSVDQAALDSATDAIAALDPGLNARQTMSTSLRITGARTEVRSDADDSLIAISTQVRPTALAGTGTPLRGSSSAIVMSLRTNTPGGRGRGRLYWPAVAGAVGADLRYSTTDSLLYLTALRAYMNAIRGCLATAFPTIGFDLAIRSRAAGLTPHVNKVQMGNVLDTQRRRRDAMVEDYQTLPFPS